MNSQPSRYTNQELQNGVRPASPSLPTENGAWVLETIRLAFDTPPALQALLMLDDVHRTLLGSDLTPNIRPQGVIAFVARMIEQHGRPQTICIDWGRAVTSKGLMNWCNSQGITLQTETRRMCPQSGYIERVARAYTKQLLRTAPLIQSIAPNSVRRRALRDLALAMDTTLALTLLTPDA